MSANSTSSALDDLVARAKHGDAAAALTLMRRVRADVLSFEVEVRVVDAIYEARQSFSSRRMQFALALLCTRTCARRRSRAVLLELVAEDYPPAMHLLGSDLIEEGRAAAGLKLLDLARDSGYRLGDVAYWRYRARMSRGPRRGLLTLRHLAARVTKARRRPTDDEVDLSYWLPE